VDGVAPAGDRAPAPRAARQTRRHAAVLDIAIREGRNRQIRRMADAIAHPIARLRRVRIGSIADTRCVRASLRSDPFRDTTPDKTKTKT
jgi:23S rRNA pseudouridine2605 synthase